MTKGQLQAEETDLCVTTAQHLSTFLQVQKFHLTDSETETLFHLQALLLILLVELVSENTIAIVVNSKF